MAAPRWRVRAGGQSSHQYHAVHAFFLLKKADLKVFPFSLAKDFRMERPFLIVRMDILG
jgi:hypothetical protein